MADDPNVPEPDDPEPVAQPEPPQVDLEAAYRVIAETEGWDPRLTRYEIQELKRRKDDLERREREFDQRVMPPPRQEPTPDFGGDQYARLAYEAKQEAAETKQMLRAFLDESRKEKEKDALISTLSTEMDTAFNAAARQAGMTREQMSNNATRQDFFALLTEMYPDPEMIARIGSEAAVRNAFRAFKGGNGTAPQRPLYRDPRASFTVPVGSSGGALSDDSGPRRSNESQEEYVARLRRVLDDAGAKMSSLPERAVINPG